MLLCLLISRIRQMYSLKNFHEGKWVSGVEYHGLVWVTDLWVDIVKCHFQSQVCFFLETWPTATSLLLLSGWRQRENDTLYSLLLAFMCTSRHIENRVEGNTFLHFQRCTEEWHHLNCQVSLHNRGRKAGSNTEGNVGQTDRRVWETGSCCLLPVLSGKNHRQTQVEGRQRVLGRSQGVLAWDSWKCSNSSCLSVSHISEQLIKTNYLCCK